MPRCSIRPRSFASFPLRRFRNIRDYLARGCPRLGRTTTRRSDGLHARQTHLESNQACRPGRHRGRAACHAPIERWRYGVWVGEARAGRFPQSPQSEARHVLVAAAGPGANFAMAALWAALAALLLSVLQLEGTIAQWLLNMCIFGMQINVILAVFNRLPIPPLDGGRVLAGLLPRSGANLLERIEPFGFMIVILSMILPTGQPLLWTLLDPFRRFFLDFYFSIAGLA